MKTYIRLFLIALPVAGLIVAAEAAYQNNTNLPGSTYKTHKLKSSAKAAACEALCDKDGQCKAWTYVKGDLFNPPRCRLKSTVPQAEKKNCCISGVKVAATEPPAPPEPPKPEPKVVWHVEQGVDRNGGDYEYWDLPVNDTWQRCQAACALVPNKCKAWTFAKAGVHGPQPRCYLKGSIPYASANPNAVSGYQTLTQ